MPTLNEIIGTNASPISTVFTTNNIAVEPLGGPTSVEDVMDRFPEETYQQGRDTHIYRLLAALCGDSGAGLAKKQAYAARLRYEAEFVNFKVLNDIYISQFQFQRLRNETYTFDLDVEALSATQWNQVEKAEQSYYHRMAKWWTATRLGNSPEGIRLAAEAGTGVECDISEHYRFIYDQYADLQLGIKPDGFTLSTSEFVVIPRFTPSEDVSFETPYEKMWVFDPPVFATGTRPVPAPSNPDDLTTVLTYVAPPAAKVELVGETTATGTTITLPPHEPGDVIVIIASQFNKAPTVPGAGGTVPTWTTEFADVSNNLYGAVVSTVATANNHTSGTFTSTRLLSASVWRPMNGTLTVGAKEKYLHQQSGESQSPFITYPGINLNRNEGISTVLRIALQRETADSQIATPPPSYTFIHELDSNWAQPSLALHYRPNLWEDPIQERVRCTNSNGPGGFIAYTIELEMTPLPTIVLETEEAKLNRYALEATQLVSKEPFYRLLPEIERNANEMLDRLKPTTTIATFKPEPNRYEVIEIETTPVASSERINVTRFVTGRANVLWPDVDPARNYFIEAGSETEPGYYYGMNRDLPVIFLTPENVRAYTGTALSDGTYGTDDFFDATNNAGVAPYEFYRSEHQGTFFPVIGAIFPFVYLISTDTQFNALNAVAFQDTPLIIEGETIT